MAIKHGVYIYEDKTVLTTPARAENSVQVVIGAAPVNQLDDPAAVTNVPILCNSSAEAREKLGYSNDFYMYPLCQSMYINGLFNVGLVVYINVLDVSTMKGSQATATIEPPFESVIKLTTDHIIKSSVSIVQTVDSVPNSLTKDVDYTLSYDDDGKLLISLIPGDNVWPDMPITVTYTPATPNSVQSSQIVGSYNASTGVATGAELIRYVYPRLDVVPSIILAPRLSHGSAVGSALSAKAANINGIFKGMALLDVNPNTRTPSDAGASKAENGFTSPHCICVWPWVEISGHLLCGSVVLAALMARTDALNDGVPSRSPSNLLIGTSNIRVCDGNRKEILLDLDQANAVNDYGIVTFIHMNGWRSWGNYTGAYTVAEDPKDVWIGPRRMFNWQGNTFILRYFEKVDNPMNQVLIESIVDSENIRCAAYAPDKWAGATIEYRKEDNPLTDILAGKITFRQRIAPYTPAQEIDNILSYDTQMLNDALSQIG